MLSSSSSLFLDTNGAHQKTNVKVNAPKTEEKTWQKEEKITDEEREEGCISEDIAYWLDCKIPDDGEEILITRKWRDRYIVEHDMCMVNDGYCLDSGLDWIDVIAWQPLPEPYHPKGE